MAGGGDLVDGKDKETDSSSEAPGSRENGEDNAKSEEVDGSKSEIEKEEFGSPLEEEPSTPGSTQSEESAREYDSSGEGAEEGESAEREVEATTEESSSGSGEETGENSSTDDNQTVSTDSEHDYRSSKLRTYVSKTPTQKRKDQTGNVTDTSEINKSGVDYVLKYEREQGREPEEQDHYNPGFDILSYDENGQPLRYIEVKSTNGPWDGYGVGLSSKQFEHAQEKGGDYWLYVVEHAKGDSPEVTCIQNPASRVDEYRFDDEWKQVDEDV